MAILNFYKPLGWTPLQCIEAYKEQHPNEKDAFMTYAGRLDPMAEGVLVVLTDEDRHKKDAFLELDKTYEATILFGFETDTYDALGLPKKREGIPDGQQVEFALADLPGPHPLPLPPYSSFKVNGKALVWWAREGRLNEIAIPIKEMDVRAIKDIHTESLSPQEVLSDIEKGVDLVLGDFRQEVILQAWRKLLTAPEPVLIATCTITVSSGTYIRSLAHALGKQLGSGAILLHLKRKAVGDFTDGDAIRFH